MKVNNSNKLGTIWSLDKLFSFIDNLSINKMRHKFSDYLLASSDISFVH